MKKYKVIINARDNRGFFPDFTGHTAPLFVEASDEESALYEARRQFESNFGYEISTHQMSYSIVSVSLAI